MVKARETNPISTLTGKVAGLDIRTPTDFFSDPQITMRGGTPLIVIDGVPNPNADFFEISADDIESISVLKGATASALYGSLGRSGALLITTKRGKDGMVDHVDAVTKLAGSFAAAKATGTEDYSGALGSKQQEKHIAEGQQLGVIRVYPPGLDKYPPRIDELSKNPAAIEQQRQRLGLSQVAVSGASSSAAVQFDIGTPRPKPKSASASASASVSGGLSKERKNYLEGLKMADLKKILVNMGLKVSGRKQN